MGENGIQYRGEGIDVDKEFQICLTNKFSLFKGIIMKHIHLKNPAMKLNKQEAARLIEYARESYFKHLRLYEFVFNNNCLLYTSPSPRDKRQSRMPSSA